MNHRRRRPDDHRNLRAESLEQRALLAVIAVGTADDFESAILTANESMEPTTIVFEDYEDPIQLDATVVYEGDQDLTIEGNGVTIQPSGAPIDLFVSVGDADLTIHDVTFQGGVNGLVVWLSNEAEGDVSVTLEDVNVTGCEEFGVHIDDLGGSSAGIYLEIVGGSFTANGTAVGDRDGIRVDERGDGSIVANVSSAEIDDNGGDGLELDEGGKGDVMLTITDSSLDGNGFVDAAEPGAEEPDYDDGLDIDEAGEGDLTLVVMNCTANGNWNQGFDIDEEDGGDLDVTFQYVDALINHAEGIKVDEKEGDYSAGGSLYAVLEHVVSKGSMWDEEAEEEIIVNEEEGIVLAEEGGGSLIASLYDVESNGNTKEGIELEETGGGTLKALLTDVETSDNLDDGTQITEEDGGSLKVRVIDSIFNDNAKYGLKVEQAGGGHGKLDLVGVLFDGNDDGDLKKKGVVLTQE